MSEQITTERDRSEQRLGEGAVAVDDLEVPEGEAENVQGGAEPCCADKNL